MTTTNLNIRTDNEIKTPHQKNGIPFELKLKSNQEITMDAIKEGRRLAKDPNAPSYKTMSALKKALDE